MARIGTFTKTSDGFTGTVQTLGISCKIAFRAIDSETDKSPDYRILAGMSEIGAAWARTSTSDRPYLSCKIDDPSFAAPLYASLVESPEGGFSLIWSR